MKSFVISSFILLISFASFCQKSRKDDIFYLWDSAWNNVPKVEKASFFTRVRFVNDTCWQHLNYRIGGPLITLEEYKDREGKLAHGRFSYMRATGSVDSMGHVVNGMLHGTWYFFNDSGTVIMKKEYSLGRLATTWNASDEKNEKSETIKNQGIESSFPGPSGSWGQYLVKNMMYPESAVSKEIQGTVIVVFMVDVEGKILDEYLVRSVEFTLDDEAFRLIRQSPKWIPAVQNGRKVKSYKKQPIEFRIR